MHKDAGTKVAGNTSSHAFQFARKYLPWLLAGVCAAAGPVRAEDPAASAAADVPEPKLEKVIVTGSNIRRTDKETPSPVEVITADDMRKSGYTSVADVLQAITANNMGSLSQANASAFAAGGSGIALRGLTVGATLVLIDGHRMATYPMPDDGQRDFVDISSIPFDVIDHIDVLKDGASAVYGSDAIAGVVNVVLKKSYTGAAMSAEVGTSYKGDGTTTHLTGIKGWGNLDSDGYNTYVALEYRKQKKILLSDRPYLANSDWTGQGGDNVTLGVPNTSNGFVPQDSATGLLADPASGAIIGALGSCSVAAANAGQCGFRNPYLTVQPETEHVNLMGRFTHTLGEDWTANVQASLFSSTATQAGVYNSLYGGSGIGGYNWGPGFGPVLTGAPTLVPANYPGNTTGQAANLIYNFPDLGPTETKSETKAWRLVAELNGTLGDWDIQSSLGYTRVVTTLKNYNFLSISGLQSAIDAGTYLVGGNNPQSVLDQIAPYAESNSHNELDFISLHGSRELLKFDNGGSVSLATGVDFTHRALDQQFPSGFSSGDQASPIFSFAVGQQNLAAVFAEVDAFPTRQLELDAAVRMDHYDTYGSSTTPKFGIKYTPLKALTLRGSYSQGFRAPNVAESGTSGSVSGVPNPFEDPVFGHGGPSSPGNLGNTNCSVFPTELQLPGKNLQPEKSDSYTLGLIFEPLKEFNLSVDYYSIQLKDQIISPGLLGQIQINNPAAYGVSICRNTAAGGVDCSANNPANTGTFAYETYPFINANQVVTNGVDIDARLHFDLKEYGKLTTQLQWTHMLKYDITQGGVVYALAGTHGPSFVSGDTGTPKDRVAFTVSLDEGALQVATTLNYIGGYSVTDPSLGSPDCATALSTLFPNGNAPGNLCNVGAFTEINLTGSYLIDKHWMVHGSVINLFNQHAPIDVQTFGAAGNGANSAGATYSPSLSQDGAIGRFMNVGVAYTF